MPSLEEITNNPDIAGAAAKQASAAVQLQGSQALILQNYALAVSQFPQVDLGSHENLRHIASDMNGALGSARENARFYLDNLLPRAITTIGNIGAYFDLESALAFALEPNTDQREAIAGLKECRDQIVDYSRSAADIARDFGNLRTKLLADSANFKGCHQKLVVIVSSDTGLLSSFDGQLKDIDSKIGGAIAGTVLGALAIVGGSILTVVGIVATVAGGSGLPVALIGGGIVAAGVAGTVGSAIALSGLVKQKQTLIQQQESLKAEIRLASGLAGSLEDLVAKADGGASAAQAMANTWNSMKDELDFMIGDIEKTNTNTTIIQQIMIRKARSGADRVREGVKDIRAQLAGVEIMGGTNVSLEEKLRQVAEQRAA